LSKYIADFGYEPIILTVDPKYATYPALDLSLETDVPPNLKVYKTKAFNPISFGSKIIGSQSIPRAGFAGGRRKGLLAQISLFIRSNIFIPDPRRGWNSYAYKAAKIILKDEKPDIVVTTGPPHSTHLIGYKIKKNFNVPWVADFRDPWTDIYYYQLLNHSKFSRWIDKRLERKVLKTANGLLTVSNGLVDLFKSKVQNAEQQFKVIPNGFDPDDFSTTESKVENKSTFTITYLGTLSNQYNPATFFKAINEILIKQIPINLRFIGTVSSEIRQMISSYSLNEITDFIDTVEHSDVPKRLLESDALLLVIPSHNSEKGILTGKLFEYLAAMKPIIAIGPPDGDAAEIIKECKAGEMFARDDFQGMKSYIINLMLKPDFLYDQNKINNYSRKQQAKDVALFLDVLTNKS
jgi:glycosyltransferase involved in cell wall biosynthesis